MSLRATVDGVVTLTIFALTAAALVVVTVTFLLLDVAGVREGTVVAWAPGIVVLTPPADVLTPGSVGAANAGVDSGTVVVVLPTAFGLPPPPPQAPTTT